MRQRISVRDLIRARLTHCATAAMFAVAIVVVVALVAGMAEPAQAQPPAMHPTLMGNLRVLDLRLVNGRVICGPLEPPRNQQHGTKNNSRSERLGFTCNGPAVSLHYELKLTDWELNYDIVNGREVTIRRTPLAATDRLKVEFHQPPEGPVVLRIDDGDTHRAFAAANLWLLLLDEPKYCAEKFVPLLEIIHPQWRVAQRVAALETSLLRTSSTAAGYDTRQVLKLVRQLGDDTFMTRQSAQRQLAEAGPTVLPLLRQLDLADLDAEQRYRLKQVMRGLVDDDDDSNERLTMLMAGDPWTWLILMRRGDEAKRKFAYERLKSMLSTPIEFDPAASPEQRAAQLSKVEQAVIESIKQTRQSLTAP